MIPFLATASLAGATVSSDADGSVPRWQLRMVLSFGAGVPESRRITQVDCPMDSVGLLAAACMGRISENLRLMVSRAVAGLDQPAPPGDRQPDDGNLPSWHVLGAL